MRRNPVYVLKTQDVHDKDDPKGDATLRVVRALVGRFFPLGYTIRKTLGGWNSGAEDSLDIEIYTPDEEGAKIRALANSIQLLNDQQSVMIYRWSPQVMFTPFREHTGKPPKSRKLPMTGTGITFGDEPVKVYHRRPHSRPLKWKDVPGISFEKMPQQNPKSYYVLINSAGKRLSGFYPNAGERRRFLIYREDGWYSFSTKEEVTNYLAWIRHHGVGRNLRIAKTIKRMD
jgi:hypothetical protein